MKVYKAAIEFQRAMLCLINDGMECKDVIHGLMCKSKPRVSPSSKLFALKLPRKLHMKDRSIELGEGVAYHDQSIVVWICIRTRFMDQVISVVRPRTWKIYINNMFFFF